MKRTTFFSSASMPAELDDRARLSLFRDSFRAAVGAVEISTLQDKRFSVEYEFLPVGELTVAHSDWTVDRVTRTPSAAAADARGDFYLTFNRSGSNVSFVQGRHASVVASGAAVLVTSGEPCEFRAADRNATLSLCVPRARLLRLVSNAEDLLGSVLDPERDSVRHLKSYLAMLFHPDGIGSDPGLIEHISTTLGDLVALALGGQTDTAEVAHMRGLRRARLQEILAHLRSRFADPGFQVHEVAVRLGTTPRYVQELLQETGRTFSERVMELRLQKARTMLADPRHDGRRISDIALGCGFNEVSYFNRCFRRRFGASPTQFRGGGSP